MKTIELGTYRCPFGCGRITVTFQKKENIEIL